MLAREPLSVNGPEPSLPAVQAGEPGARVPGAALAAIIAASTLGQASGMTRVGAPPEAPTGTAIVLVPQGLAICAIMMMGVGMGLATAAWLGRHTRREAAGGDRPVGTPTGRAAVCMRRAGRGAATAIVTARLPVSAAGQAMQVYTSPVSIISLASDEEGGSARTISYLIRPSPMLGAGRTLA